MIALLVWASVAVVPIGTAFRCTPERVYDGDGPVWCREGPRLRLGGIAAREMDGSCRVGHPCPATDARLARDTLVTLLGGGRGTARGGHVVVAGPVLDCVSSGGAGGTRTAAWCTLPDGRSLSCAMIASGAAAPWPRFFGLRRCNGSYLTSGR